MIEDYKFVYRTIRHAENKFIHYPAIKNLISLFKTKWNTKKKNTAFDVYYLSLSLAFKKSFK